MLRMIILQESLIRLVSPSSSRVVRTRRQHRFGFPRRRKLSVSPAYLKVELNPPKSEVRGPSWVWECNLRTGRFAGEPIEQKNISNCRQFKWRRRRFSSSGRFAVSFVGGVKTSRSGTPPEVGPKRVASMHNPKYPPPKGKAAWMRHAVRDDGVGRLKGLSKEQGRVLEPPRPVPRI